MIEIKKASEIVKNISLRISEIFMKGFGEYFQFFSKDEKVLSKAFAHMFNLNVFYIALIHDEIVGIGACTNGMEKSVAPKLLLLIKYLGLIKGIIAYTVVGKYFNKPPRKMGNPIASLEFFATDPRYREKGIASTLIQYLMDNETFEEYILEVADTNEKAVRLYKKLGFEEYDREEEENKEKSGINFLLHMSFKKK